MGDLKDMKKFFTNLFIVLLVLVGLALVFNKQIEHFIIDKMSENKVENLSRADVLKNQTASAEFDFSKVGSLGPGEIYNGMIGDAHVIGKMAVPSVKVALPISKGLSDAALSSGGGTMKKDEVMGEGNYAIAGHYLTHKAYKKNSSQEIGWTPLFSNLPSAPIGEKIYLTDMSKVYVYKIHSKKVIAPTETQVIDDVPGKKMVTLITCADSGTNRWSIQGNLVSVEKATKKNLKVFSKTKTVVKKKAAKNDSDSIGLAIYMHVKMPD